MRRHYSTSFTKHSPHREAGSTACITHQSNARVLKKKTFSMGQGELALQRGGVLPDPWGMVKMTK